MTPELSDIETARLKAAYRLLRWVSLTKLASTLLRARVTTSASDKPSAEAAASCACRAITPSGC